MTPDNESINGRSRSMSIHIPWDILNDQNHYKCPNTVNIELSPRGSRARNSRKNSHSTRSQGQGQGHITKGNDRKLTMSSMMSKETTTSSSVCPSHRHFSSFRSCEMESSGDPEGSANQNNFHDMIEMVAAANEHLTDFTYPSELPELRASPCLFHNRHHQSSHNLSPHRHTRHSSNFHNRCSPRSNTSKQSDSSGHNVDSTEARIQMERTKLFHQDVQHDQIQSYSKPALPQVMTSKDFIQSWLQHGSHPTGHNHFPEVITPPKPSKHNNATHTCTHFNNRLKLDPIISRTSSKTKKQKRLSSKQTKTEY